MATTATTKREGSYALSILSAAAAAVCMTVTAMMVRQLGESLGATDSGRELLSYGTVAVPVALYVAGMFRGATCGAAAWC